MLGVGAPGYGLGEGRRGGRYLEVRMIECLGLEHQAMKSSLANPHSRSGMLASTTFGAGTYT